MPPYSRTEPHLAVKPHAAMNLSAGKNLANYEEIHPRKESIWAEAPLIIFTLLAQMAVGGFWSMLWIFTPLWNLAQGDQILLRAFPLLVIGIALGLGMVSSFAHLGTKKNAWRVLKHLRKSWLSREILSASLFGMGWLAVIIETVIFQRATPILLWLVAIPGFYLIHSMSNVYRLPAKPAWNTWRTNAAFFASALLLGELSMAAVLIFESYLTGISLPNVRWQIVCFSALALLASQLAIMDQSRSGKTTRIFRVGLILTAMFAITSVFLFSEMLTIWSGIFIFLLVLAEEIMGRWMFFERASFPGDM
jgi:anaerobic dimethyl sulfoxide reductase subunit C (anchor subunit)